MAPDETDATGRTNGHDSSSEGGDTIEWMESEHYVFLAAIDLTAWFRETTETE